MLHVCILSNAYLKTIETVTNTIKCEIYKEAVICKALQSWEVNLLSFSGSVNINVVIHDKDTGTEIPGEN